MSTSSIRIGGASGFWGETALSTPQLISGGNLDFIVYDYLAEITLSIMARARAADDQAGYATDFVSTVLANNLRDIAKRGIRVISNAGGVNPQAAASATRQVIDQLGLSLTVAVVTGDDLMDQIDSFSDVNEMFTGDIFPPAERIASINAYLGAFPIALALDQGADIVITGRCVDSAVTLGACIHHFGWRSDDFDRLAAGSIAGHLLECGPQATGGNFTDWLAIADSMHDIGYPIAEVAADGTFTISKPPDTGGVVSIGTVAEQLLYEVGDPQSYALPDVVCDFSAARIEAIDRDVVAVSGIRGRPPTDQYKVSAIYMDGYRAGQTLLFYGEAADEKARLFADGVLRRVRALLADHGLQDYDDVLVELTGNEHHYGDFRAVNGAREVQLKIAARHASKAAVGMLLRETIGAALGGPPGLTGFAGTRPRPSPVMRLFSFLIDKTAVDITVSIGDETRGVSPEEFTPIIAPPISPPSPPEDDTHTTTVPLIDLAWARSGDKGDKANIGVIARLPEYLPYIWQALQPEVVADRFAHFTSQPVDRYFLPGIAAVNFVLHDVLGGGGVASLRNDPQGKGYAQLLLATPIEIPLQMARELSA
ncbi:MAG: acyclic terpene utilization AtuA family protein [Pseudomonadota bacterium]